MKNRYNFLQRIRPIELALVLKKILRVRRVVFNTYGYLWWIDPASRLGDQLIEYGSHEPALSAYFSKNLKEGQTFVDLGANEGWFSVLAAKKVGPKGRVISIEPQERLWPILIKNFYLNSLFNYQLVPCAIGENEGDKEMILNPELNHGASSFVKNTRRFFWQRQQTPIRTLDAVFTQYNLDQVDMMKIDIEGYEYYAIRSGESVFSKKKVLKVVVDVHQQQLRQLGISPQQIQDFFTTCDYHLINEDGIAVFVANRLV